MLSLNLCMVTLLFFCLHLSVTAKRKERRKAKERLLPSFVGFTIPHRCNNTCWGYPYLFVVWSVLQRSGAAVAELCKQNHCRQRDRGCQELMQISPTSELGQIRKVMVTSTDWIGRLHRSCVECSLREGLPDRDQWCVEYLKPFVMQEVRFARVHYSDFYLNATKHTFSSSHIPKVR